MAGEGTVNPEASSLETSSLETSSLGAVDTGRLPNLVMAGPGKAGTTSLFWYLSQHPEICPSSVKEIRYFAPITHGERTLPPLEDYASHFDGCGREKYRLEASPQYFHGGASLIEAMRKVLTDPRVIIVLREPVARLWSIYRSNKVRRSLPASLTFDEYVAASERLRADRAPLTRENRAYWTISGEFYIDHIVAWLDAFGDDLRVVFFEHLAEQPAITVGEICRWLDIDDRLATSFNYSVENRTVANRSRILHRVALAANSGRFLGERRTLKGPLRRAYYAINRKPQAERMPPDTQRRLKETFDAANEALAAELRGRGYTDLPAWLGEAGGSVSPPSRPRTR